VVGTERGHRARRLRRGSVSGYCRKHAHCPVVIVPAAGQPGRGAPPRRQVAAGPDAGPLASGQS
jgi:hypothetical protein